MRGRRLVITGTDTGVGKTHIGCALAYTMREQGATVRAIKPIESGCSLNPDGGEDGVRLALAANQETPAHALIRLGAPVAPPVAADAENMEIPFGDLMGRVRDFAAEEEMTLVEGAGGLLSPLTWQHSTLDMALSLEAPALVVARDCLGTLNQIRLTLEALEHRDVPVIGVVLVVPEMPDASTFSNRESLERVVPGIRVWEIPWCSDPRGLIKDLGPLAEVLLS